MGVWGVGVWVCEFSFASQSLIVNVGSYLAGGILVAYLVNRSA